MIVLHWPLMLLALIPIIVLESFLMRDLVPIEFGKALLGVAKANLFSTAVGVPIAWAAMLVLEFATLLPIGIAAQHWGWDDGSPAMQLVIVLLGSAWIPGGDAVWIVPGAIAVLLIPSFLVSVWLERKSCLRSWPELDAARIRRSVLLSNAASYGLLFLLACAWIGAACVTGKIYVVSD